MNNQRKVYIDYLRVFACISVILIHVFTSARTDFINHTDFEEIISKIFQNILHFAVPVFFMITGYLFLTKDKDLEYKDFFKKYILKYIVAIFTFGWGYAIIEEIFNKNYCLSMPFTALLNTIQGKTWAHMWYLYSLVGVMLLIPIIKKLLDKDEKSIKYISTILLISSFVFPLIELVFDIKIGFDLIIVSPYLLYAIIGYYLGKNNLEKDSIKYIIGLFISLVIIIIAQVVTVLYCDDAIISKISFVGKYNSIIILLLAVCIFILFKKIITRNRIVEFTSKYTYGIYLVHVFYINLIYKFFNINIYGNYFLIKSLTVFVVVFLFSLITTMVMKKIPLLKNIV